MAFVLVQKGKAREVFEQLPELHSDLMAALVETQENIKPGQPFNGVSFEPIPAPREETAAEKLKKTDAEFIRVTEDLIAVLISKGVITAGDLPQAAQDKINERSALRAQL